MTWCRAPKMDAYAAELLEQHAGSLELEEREKDGANLPPRHDDLAATGPSSTSALGEGVHSAETKLGQSLILILIDPDSLRTPHTITPVQLTRGRRVGWPSQPLTTRSTFPR